LAPSQIYNLAEKLKKDPFGRQLFNDLEIFKINREELFKESVPNISPD
jgi:hypothetical protein